MLDNIVGKPAEYWICDGLRFVVHLRHCKSAIMDQFKLVKEPQIILDYIGEVNLRHLARARLMPFLDPSWRYRRLQGEHEDDGTDLPEL
jgi:hypothetical protein